MSNDKGTPAQPPPDDETGPGTVQDTIHDLRNPLSIAQQYLSLARQSPEKEHFDEIEAALERIETIITTRLEIPATDHQSIETSIIPVTPVVARAWKTATAGESGYKLVYEADRHATLRVNRSHFQSLLENLFRNVVEHTEPGTTVWVGELEDKPGIFVADDGPGIPEEHQSEIFKSGFTTTENGTGLGLQIVAEIATLYDWTITVTNSHNDGAQFNIEIPASQWNPEEPTQSS